MSNPTLCVRRNRSIPWLLLPLFLWVLPTAAEGSTRTMVDKAVQLMHQERFEAALDILHAVERRIANPERINGLLGSAYIGQGYRHLNKRHYEEAMTSFEAAHDYTDDDFRLWLGEGVAAYQLGQYGVAENALQQAIVIDDQQAQAYLMLGRVYYAEGYLYDALNMLERAQEIDDNENVRAFLEKVRREYRIEQQMERDLEGMFRISFADDGQSALAGEILDVLNDAYSELGSQLNVFPTTRVPVLLYSRSDFAEVTRSPDWAGAVYDGKIRIPLGGVRRMTPQLEALLYHEYAHVIVHSLGRGRVPTWLNEGLAELAGRWKNDPPLSHFPAAVERREMLAWESLAHGFGGLSPAQIPLAYEQSYSMVAYLVDQFGWFNLADLVALLGQGVAFEDAVQRVYAEYGVDWDDIFAEWQAVHLGTS